jgi:DNA replication initiation complex subunit (GINS family)
MDRQQLIELRPIIPSATSDQSKSIEYFQNEVLRPVIKMQHAIVISFIQSNEQFRLLLVNKGARIDFQTRIHNFISKQQAVKHQLIGMILGMLTEEEFALYSKHQNEFNKRISQMISQRFTDTFY